MEIIEVLAIIILIIIFIAVISFCLISIIIYIKDCTIKLFLIWISSYVILVGFSYLIDSKPVQLYFSLFLISSMTSIFFILRIEERSFNLQYLFGLLISMISLLFVTYLSDPASFSFFRELNGLLFFIFIFYFPKIFIYNKLIKKKSIKYPIFIIAIPAYLLFTALITRRFYEFLEVLSHYFVFIAFLSIFFFQLQIKDWIRRVLNEHYEKKGQENRIIKKIKDIFNNRHYYLFNWDNFNKEDCKKLRNYLLYKFHYDWIKDAEIRKSNDNEIKVIDITTKDNSAEIMMDDKKEKVSLKLNNDRIYDLQVNVKEQNGRLKIYKTSKKIIPIEPIEISDHYLCDEIDDAIINDNNINFEKINMQALRFMLVCANKRKERILLELSIFKAFIFAAFALAVPPLIDFMLLFFEGMEKLQLRMDEIYFPTFENWFSNFLSNFFENLFQFNELFASIFIIIVFFIPIFYFEELILWFKLIMKKYLFVDLIYKIIIGIIFIGFVIKVLLSMEIIISNVLLCFFSFLCMIISNTGSKTLNRQLNRNYQIILNLNERIIFG